MHCVGRVLGLSSSAMERFTLLACMHWLQRGGRYSPFQCFADSPKATQSCCICAFVLYCDFTPSLLSITIPCYLSNLPYLGWNITGYISRCHGNVHLNDVSKRRRRPSCFAPWSISFSRVLIRRAAFAPML